MNDQIKTRRCPGCGCRQQYEYEVYVSNVGYHDDDCPWADAYDAFDGDADASAAYADAKWRNHWHPKTGDWITNTDAQRTFKTTDKHLIKTYPKRRIFVPLGPTKSKSHRKHKRRSPSRSQIRQSSVSR